MRSMSLDRGFVEWQDCHVSPGSCQHVAVLAIEAVVGFDLSIPCQVFGHRDEAGRYRLSVCSAGPQPVATTTGYAIAAPFGLEALADADTVVVPGYEYSTPIAPAIAKALAGAHARGARMVSICTGAFALAQAGLLDGRRATTHWRDAAELAACHPLVDVDPNVLYVDDGDVLTSAGVAAGLDLCLHLVREDHGAEAANEIARRMVVAPQRAGGQAQFVDRPVDDGDSSLEPTRVWLLDRLPERTTVAEMARHAGYSERSFHRRFVAETGTSPLRWLQTQRVLEARRLLQTTSLPVEHVATLCGFGSAAMLRTQFGRVTKSTPTAYRQAWLAA
jgi:transcriptional regulator GlxA family with amidase domain